MTVGTKIQMDNGYLGIQQGVIIDDSGWCPVVRWDTEEVDDDEELGDNFSYFSGEFLPDDWEFTYIKDNGDRK